MKAYIMITSDNVEICIFGHIKQGMKSSYIALKFCGAAPLSLIENITCVKKLSWNTNTSRSSENI